MEEPGGSFGGLALTTIAAFVVLVLVGVTLVSGTALSPLFRFFVAELTRRAALLPA